MSDSLEQEAFTAATGAEDVFPLLRGSGGLEGPVDPVAADSQIRPVLVVRFDELEGFGIDEALGAGQGVEAVKPVLLFPETQDVMPGVIAGMNGEECHPFLIEAVYNLAVLFQVDLLASKIMGCDLKLLVTFFIVTVEPFVQEADGSTRGAFGPFQVQALLIYFPYDTRGYLVPVEQVAERID